VDGEDPINLLGPKKLSQAAAVADLVYGRLLVLNNSHGSQRLWVGMRPWADKSQQSSLHNYQGT